MLNKIMTKHVAKLRVVAAAAMLAVSACGDVAGPGSDEYDDADGGAEVKAASSARYEAENRSAQNGSSVASNHTGYTGSGFVAFGGTGTWLEWNAVSASVAGQYTLTLRYANGVASARPVAVSVNGAAAGTVQLAPTGNWDTWRNMTIAASLRPGNNTIRLTSTTSSAGPNVDHLDVPAISPPPPPPPTSAYRIPLPIEVLGPAGTRVTVQFRVTDPSNITHLYVRCNACGFQDETLDMNANRVKASVRVNGRTPIPLKHFRRGSQVIGNSQIEIIGAEANYGGIGGPFRTVRMKVPVTGIVAGVNTLVFEHVTPAPPSIGYRIIELNLLRGNQLSNKVLPPQDFAPANPATWTPPLTSAADITAGRNLWSRRNALTDPGVDAINGSANGSISASCADCHASDGRDLAYFNFSNDSIVARSVFHGLSQTDGRRIASYIRNLDIPVAPDARPWNPAYQPGPDMDAKPVYQWAGGAGVDAILDNDSDMDSELFPNGQSLADVRQVVDRFDTLNLRELPIAIPLPEWNQWLPRIHPDDAFNTQAPAVRSDKNGVNLGEPYYTRLYELASANPNRVTLGNMTTQIKAWLSIDQTCKSNGPGGGEAWRGLDSAVLRAVELPKAAINAANCNNARTQAQEQAYEVAKHGLAAWLSVKQWEIVHGNNLETEGSRETANVCAGTCVNASEPRGWVVDGRNVFDRTPHFLAHNTENYYGQDPVSGFMESNSWYHLNMVLNPGYRRTMPTHFPYVYLLTEVLQRESGVDQGFRFWAGMIKQRQLQTNGNYGVEEGLDLRTAQPYIYYATRHGATAPQDTIGLPLWRLLVQATLEDFVEDANRATAQDWANARGESAVQARNSTDLNLCNNCAASAQFEVGAYYQGRNTYRVIPLLRARGVSGATLNTLIGWGRSTWPNGNWNALL